MAAKKSGDAGARSKNRAVRKPGQKLKDLDSKKAREIRGGAMEVYLNIKGTKQGDIKGP